MDFSMTSVTPCPSTTQMIAIAWITLGAIAALVASRGAAARPLLIAAAFEACVGVEASLTLRHFAHIAIYGR